MVFSSLTFLFAFLPTVLLVNQLCPARYRNYVLLPASCFFYAWGAPRFILVLLGSSALDFGLSRMMGRPGDARQAGRKRLLVLAVAINLAVFLFFKYANFCVEEINHLLSLMGGRQVGWTRVVLPIGISFFTFQKLSYLVDVYRGTVRPARSLVSYMLYVSSFPQLIAGPIVRYHDVAEQLEHREQTVDRMFSGIIRFCIGLAKKVLIANVLGQMADQAFGAKIHTIPASLAWLGLFCYSFQIYFDFAGYSDMAIGLGRMLGFEFLENFNCPYIARSFSEFWRRWHISLSNWMKEYLYIPLGGNRAGKYRVCLNLWIIFLLSGFWHGASWNFVVWGACHGLFISLDKLTTPVRREVPALVAMPLTYLLVTLGWVFFRAEDMAHAIGYFRRLFLLTGDNAIALQPTWGTVLEPTTTLALCVAAGISFLPAFTGIMSRLRERCVASHGITVDLMKFAAAILALFWSAASLTTGGFNPFIYFRF